MGLSRDEAIIFVMALSSSAIYLAMTGLFLMFVWDRLRLTRGISDWTDRRFGNRSLRIVFVAATAITLWPLLWIMATMYGIYVRVEAWRWDSRPTWGSGSTTPIEDPEPGLREPGLASFPKP